VAIEDEEITKKLVRWFALQSTPTTGHFLALQLRNVLCGGHSACSGDARRCTARSASCCRRRCGCRAKEEEHKEGEWKWEWEWEWEWE
jgi:hypothetical protein